MGWFSRFRSLFRPKEKVNLLDSTPEKLEIIPYKPYSDEKIVPGIAKNPSSNITVSNRGLTYFNTPGATAQWVPPQYDHLEIEVLFDVESYFARATRAKLALFMKEGYEFIGANDSHVEYIRARIRQIEKASKIPFSILLNQTCRDLLVHSNAYWLKVRKEKASGGKVRQVGNKTIQPVAGYFSLPPETMNPLVDSSGNITKWKQVIYGNEKVFSLDDIVHFYTNKKEGYPLGIPSLVPVVDDIRALRSIEHSIDILIHKHLFPIILWQVGTESIPAQTFSDGSTEISIVQDLVSDMPTEGSLVVPERYDVKAVGVENKALNVEYYLNFFRERLLAGLDVSSIDVGIGSTASRSTAFSLSRNLVDIVKLQQIVIQEFSNPVIDELLLESTFSDLSVSDPEDIVRLKFHEIDKETKQAEANHLVDLFHKNAINYPELRQGIGKEVLTPEEENELWWNKFGREQALIGSVDELSGKGAPPPEGSEDNSVNNKNNPENQHGKRGSSKLNKDSNLREEQNPILSWHKIIGAELQIRWAEGRLRFPLAETDIITSYNLALDDFSSILHSVIRRIYRDPMKINGIYKYMDGRAQSYIWKLRNEVIRRLKEKKNTPNVVFSSLEYRTELIFKSELSLAHNISKYRWLSDNQVDMKVVGSDNPCDICKPKLTSIKWNDKLGEANIPPFHVQCQCKVVGVEE
jgi:hypothetical protein